MRSLISGFLLVCVVMFSSSLVAQIPTDTLTEREAELLRKKLDRELKKSTKTSSFRVFPAIYYTPETNLALGAVGMYAFKVSPKDTNLAYSRIMPSAIYTLNKQLLLSAKFEINLTTNWVATGQIGYYLYPYFFAGVGNDVDIDYREWYDAEYPLIELSLYRKMISPKFSVGPKMRFQNTTIQSVEDSGLLDIGNVTGAQGSAQTALGIGAKYDSRDYLLSPTKGWFVQGSSLWGDESLGGSYYDQFLLLDIRKYFPLFEKDVFALQVYSELHTGDVPFNLMAQLGGQNQMRGYRQGVYRDKQMMVYQAEYRSRLFFKYFGFAVFGSVGGIGTDFEEVNANYRYTYGAGLRISMIPEKRVFLRVDYGMGNGTNGLYIAIGEAF